MDGHVLGSVMVTRAMGKYIEAYDRKIKSDLKKEALAKVLQYSDLKKQKAQVEREKMVA